MIENTLTEKVEEEQKQKKLVEMIVYQRRLVVVVVITKIVKIIGKVIVTSIQMMKITIKILLKSEINICF